ncbi:hypothetical protein AAG906_033285 [Vitis piasezkii]
MDRRQRRNPSASSSAFSSPASSSSRFRSEKFSSNPQKLPQRPEQEEEGEQDPNNLLSLVGTCPFMCPGPNVSIRDLAVFERLHGNPGKTSPSLAVKKVNPTSHASIPVGRDFELPIKLLDATEHPFEVVHDFVFDRTRSIRQDLSMRISLMIKQFICMKKCFAIVAASQIFLRSLPQYGAGEKVSISLYALSEENRNSNSIYKNEPEFCSFHVLLHLGSNNQPLSLSLWLGRVPSLILKSKEMSLALSCVNYYGYKLHPYPIAHLSKLLMMKELDVESFCNACGLETSTGERGNKFLSTKQTNFHYPKEVFPSYCLLGLEHF